MTLHLLPTRTGGAAENMALDFLLLQRYPHAKAARFRHYEWRGPAFTFGLSQSLEFVRAQLPAGENFDLCRRPTGGGVVDHRDDWTYTLVIPRGHPLEAERATQSYRSVHACLADALRALGAPVVLKERHVDQAASALPGVCFQRAEVFDVLNEHTGDKVAGAAQKRNKNGLLLQGSIWKPAVGALDWEAFAEKFSSALALALDAKAEPAPWPEFADGEVEALIEQYSSPEWMEYR
ncbi:MAG TPA: lipoate--protein ligase family protein [Opitutaceae bacterium]|jgi:lipoate-protein ligase A|nr:lipoate--protein ligase family protein [Opitutaceae bacterium]